MTKLQASALPASCSPPAVLVAMEGYYMFIPVNTRGGYSVTFRGRFWDGGSLGHVSNASACNGTSPVSHLPWDIFARPDCCYSQSWNIVVISCLLCVRGMPSISAGPASSAWFRGFTQSHGRFLPRHHWHPVYWSPCQSCCQGAPMVIIWYCRHFEVCAFVFTSVGTKSWQLPLRPRDARLTGAWCLFVWCSEETLHTQTGASSRRLTKVT